MAEPTFHTPREKVASGHSAFGRICFTFQHGGGHEHGAATRKVCPRAAHGTVSAVHGEAHLTVVCLRECP